MIYLETQLVALAKNNTKELIRILTSPNTKIPTLTSGLEILGAEISDETIVLPIFRQLLKHVHAGVREASAIGISAFYLEKLPPTDILNKLMDMSDNDPSSFVKDYIKTILKDFEKLK